MCTNFALIKKDGTARLAARLGVSDDDWVFSSNHKPGSQISVVCQNDGENRVLIATWWLYLQQTATGLKPHPDYFSVNTNHAKLAQKAEYRTSRCVIPVSAFVESQGGKRPYLLEPNDGSAMPFGGLYKHWVDKVSGEEVFSASIITLSGHPALENIHRKSTPLWLPDDALDAWLDPDMPNTEIFKDLLVPALRVPLRATPIDKTMLKNPIGESFLIDG